MTSSGTDSVRTNRASPSAPIERTGLGRTQCVPGRSGTDRGGHDTPMPSDDPHHIDFDTEAQRIAEATPALSSREPLNTAGGASQPVEADRGETVGSLLSACRDEGGEMVGFAPSRNNLRVNQLGMPANAPLTESTATVAPDSDSNPPRTDRDPASGRFLRGNRTALRHGLYGVNVEAVMIEERQAFEAASIADDGDDLPERRRSLHRYRASLHVQIEALAASLEKHGQFDRRGKLRAGWLSKYESLIAAAVRIDAVLGLDRKPKDVLGIHAQIAEAERQRQERGR